MNDLEKKLEKIEQQLQVISSNQSPVFGNQVSSRSDEIDLRELFSILWQGKWWIIGVTFLFAVAGVAYALSLPNMYKSEGVYAPAQKQGGNSLSGQLGGLASLAGVSLVGGESNDLDQAMALIISWSFLEKVIEKYNLKPLIMGVKGWSVETKELIWDEETYDPVNKIWLSSRHNGEEGEPSSYSAFKAFRKNLIVSKDSKTGLVTISYESYSPLFAAEVVDVVLKELNAHFQKRDIVEATESIEYLKEKVTETGIAEMQTVFYSMIESQIKALMLAQVNDEYVLKTVVQRKVSEERSSPNKLFILVIFIFCGGFTSSVIWVVICILKRKKNECSNGS